MLDELRTLFLAALLHSDIHSAVKLIDDWNAACDRIQKVFDNLTEKNPNLKEVIPCCKCEHWAESASCINYGSCDRDALIRHKDFYCADAELAKEVEWIKRDNGQFIVFECPICGKDATPEDATYDNHCSYCGSKMRKI